MIGGVTETPQVDWLVPVFSGEKKGDGTDEPRLKGCSKNMSDLEYLIGVQ